MAAVALALALVTRRAPQPGWLCPSSPQREVVLAEPPLLPAHPLHQPHQPWVQSSAGTGWVSTWTAPSKSWQPGPPPALARLSLFYRGWQGSPGGVLSSLASAWALPFPLQSGGGGGRLHPLLPPGLVCPSHWPQGWT